MKNNYLFCCIAACFILLNNASGQSTQKVGNTTWCTRNLDVVTFRNGDSIPEARSKQEWVDAHTLQEPVWCYYMNDPKNKHYGKIYNWFALNDPRGLAPYGLRIPKYDERPYLFGGETDDFIGGRDKYGDFTKGSYWWSGDECSNNEMAWIFSVDTVLTARASKGVGAYLRCIKDRLEILLPRPQGFPRLQTDKNGTIWMAADADIYRIENLNITKYTAKDGLPGKDIRCITFDKNNNVWVGTTVGIYKFDGAKWTAVKEAGDKYTNSVAIDSKLRIWYTNDDELYCIEGGKSKKIKVKEAEKFDLHSHIAIDSHDNVWIVPHNFDGLYMYNGDDIKFFPYIDPYGQSVERGLYWRSNGMYLDNDENVWVLCDVPKRGMYIITGCSGFIRFDGNWKAYIQGENTYSICQTESGDYWSSTDKGLYKNFVKYGDKYSYGRVAPAKDSNFWIWSFDRLILLPEE